MHRCSHAFALAASNSPPRLDGVLTAHQEPRRAHAGLLLLLRSRACSSPTCNTLLFSCLSSWRWARPGRRARPARSASVPPRDSSEMGLLRPGVGTASGIATTERARERTGTEGQAFEHCFFSFDEEGLSRIACRRSLRNPKTACAGDFLN